MFDFFQNRMAGAFGDRRGHLAIRPLQREYTSSLTDRSALCLRM